MEAESPLRRATLALRLSWQGARSWRPSPWGRDGRPRTLQRSPPAAAASEAPGAIQEANKAAALALRAALVLHSCEGQEPVGSVSLAVRAAAAVCVASANCSVCSSRVLATSEVWSRRASYCARAGPSSRGIMAFSRPAGPHRQRPAAASNSPPPHNLLAQPLQRHVHAAAHPPGAAADGQRAAPAPAARSTSRDSRSGSRSTRNGTSSAAPRAPPPSQPSKASAPHGAREQHKAPAQAAAPPPSWQQQQQQRLQATGDRPGAGRGPRGPAPPPSTQGGPDQRQRSRDSGAKKADRKAAKATKLSAEQELTQRRKVTIVWPSGASSAQGPVPGAAFPHDAIGEHRLPLEAAAPAPMSS